MALDGGGSGGGPLGQSNSFTGPALGIEYVGNGWWGGWSGDVITTNGSAGTLFEFQSPSATILMRFTLIVDRSLLGTNEIGYDLTMNGRSVANYRMPNTNNTQDLDALELIIPSFTDVKITAETDDGDNITVNGILVAQVIA